LLGRRVCRVLIKIPQWDVSERKAWWLIWRSDSEHKHLLFWELRAGQFNQYFNTERKREKAIIQTSGASMVVNGLELRDGSVVYNEQSKGASDTKEWSVRA
jgi:hypothetical protein